MAVSHYQGMFQNFLVGLVNAKRVLEIGTFTGSSAIFFANALKRNGVKPSGTNKPVIGLDISKDYAKIACANFAKAGVEDYIQVIVGDARKNLAKLEGQVFDVVFLDADKTSYKDYYDTVLEKNILAENGIIIADNTAFDCVTPFVNIPAPVADDAAPLNVSFSGHPERKEFGKAIHEFNEYIRKDPRTEAVMVPLFTGITLIRRLNNSNNN
ncbi:O-methyltransferase [Coemansia spiralis]|nr:O-methyltransferase [Coemansia spiralis]